MNDPLSMMNGECQHDETTQHSSDSTHNSTLTTQHSLVPRLRFGEFEGEWSISPINDLALSYKLGGNYANSENITDAPLIKMGNIGRGLIKLNKVEYVSEGEDISEDDKIKEDDLFFNTRNTLELVGKVAIWRNELPVAYFNSNLMRLLFESNRFMNYRFNSFEGIKGLRRLATGTTSVAAIYTKDLLKLKFTIPTLPEQTKIASFLTSVDDRIDQLKRKKSLLQDYKKGVMQRLFAAGKKSVELGVVSVECQHDASTQHSTFTTHHSLLRFKDNQGNAFPDWASKEFDLIVSKLSEKHNPVKTTVSYPCVELESLSQGTGQLLETFLSADQKSIKNKFLEGQVLFGKLRPYLKKFLHAKFEGVCSSEIWVFEGIEVTNSFLFHLIQTSKFNQAANVSSGSKMPRSDWSYLSAIPFRYPTNQDEQTKIANFLTALDQKIEQVSTQITETQNFKKGLLQQMFV